VFVSGSQISQEKLTRPFPGSPLFSPSLVIARDEWKLLLFSDGQHTASKKSPVAFLICLILDENNAIPEVYLRGLTQNYIEFQPIRPISFLRTINGPNNGCEHFTFIYLAGPREIEGPAGVCSLWQGFLFLLMSLLLWSPMLSYPLFVKPSQFSDPISHLPSPQNI
jgi:hypothetical protein